MDFDLRQLEVFCAAVELLEHNRIAGAIVPSRAVYPHQWLWDACFHAMALAHHDVEAAQRELESLLLGQWPDGMLPHVRFLEHPSVEYRPGAAQWATGHPTTGITQPPLVATALRHLQQLGCDRAWLDSMVHATLRHHRWLRRFRDPQDSGLIGIVHPWESGTDNSPVFDRIRDDYLAEFPDAPLPQRADRAVVDGSQRPRDRDYRFYWGLITTFQGLGWQPGAMADRSPSWIADLTINSIWARANADLARLAQQTGRTDEARQLRTWSQRTRRALLQRCWSPQHGLFLPLDLRCDRLIPVKTCGGLLPLITGPLEPAVVERLADHLADERTFSARFGVPSVALDEPEFDARSYWRGPVWLHIHWLLALGLREHGRADLASRLAACSRECVSRSGYREYYHPINGEGLGAPEFSWSVLADVME